MVASDDRELPSVVDGGDRSVGHGDAKYKKGSAGGAQNADLYQLLAYVIGADLPAGLLIYAAGEDEPHVDRVIRIAKELHITGLDLQGNPAEVLSRIGAIANRVRVLRNGLRTQLVA